MNLFCYEFHMKVSSCEYSFSHDDRYSTLIAEKVDDIYNCVNAIFDNRNSFTLSKTQNRLFNYYKIV